MTDAPTSSTVAPGSAVRTNPIADGAAMRRTKGLSLRFKFLAFNLLIAFVPTIILFSAWEYASYNAALRELEEKLDEVLAIQSDILAAPLWNLEGDRMQLVLDAILKDSDFVMAAVSDHRGRLMAQSGVISPHHQGQVINSSHAIVSGSGDSTELLGELSLIATDTRISELVTKHLYLDVAIIALWLLASITAALVAFRRTIDTPLSRLLEAIHSTGQNLRRKRVNWSSEDEMGVVVRQFNKMQDRQEEYEDELQSAQANLERRVKERTVELVTARDEAHAASNAKSEFLAVMSHELRTPLNGVLGLTETLMDTTLSREQNNQLALIKESGWGLMSLLNDMLDLTKVETGSLKLEYLTFDLEHMVKRVTELWTGIIADKGLTFTLETPDELLPLIHSDPTRLRQVIQNLLSNAIKFTDAGEVSMTVTWSALAGNRARIAFQVRDTGPGIDSDVQSSIFDRFTQADTSITRRFGGSGLGLSICRELVALMDGTIGVSSEAGSGSAFWFTIECDIGEEADKVVLNNDQDTPDDDGTQSGLEDLQILVAEDNHVNRMVIKAILDSFGIKAAVVENGSLALEAVKAGGFDIVLMDVQMPVMDGITATAEIRALEGESASIPVIALTANAMHGDRERYLAQGFTEYVSKPIDARALHTALVRCSRAGIVDTEVPAQSLQA